MNYAIRTEQLTKRFGSCEAVHDLTLDIPEGSIFAFLGPNGAGKTTTIKLLVNILRAARGSATVLGVDSRRLAPADFTQIGYVSENQEMPEWMTVQAFLEYCRAFYPAWDQALCDKLVRQFELPSKNKLKNLSRGMKMKAALASSIAYRPKLLILDEPFSGLDPLVRDELIEGILEISAEHQWTVFVSSHDLAEIENLASHIGYLDHGRLQFSEELASVVSRFREVEVTLANPGTLPTPWPAGWMKPESSGAVVRFIVSQFNDEVSPPQIQQLFSGCTSWNARPLPLRSIFTALAKSGR
jgi:ABC-2 type transport system ATP-binding protein